MYAKLNNEVIEKYPYTIGDLRKDNPNVSFPAHISKEILEHFNVVPVVMTGCPEIDYTKNVSEVSPEFIQERNRWEQTWATSEATSSEIEQRLAEQWSKIREQRNSKLSSSDWTQVADAPVNALQWAIYRQALRDVTLQADPFNISWPVSPMEETNNV